MKVTNSLAVFLLAVATVFVHAQAQTTTSSNSISIEHPWARATFAGGKTGSAYLTIRNSGTSSDRLIEASTPLAKQGAVSPRERCRRRDADARNAGGNDPSRRICDPKARRNAYHDHRTDASAQSRTKLSSDPRIRAGWQG